MHPDNAFCPHCGAKRPEWARYCASCGNAYDAAPAGSPASAQQPAAWTVEPASAAPAADAVTPAPMPKPAGSRTVLVGLAATALLLVGAFLVYRVATGGGGATTTASNLPAVGAIWFGDSFDTGSFEIANRRTSGVAGTSVALVAQLPESVESGDVNLEVAVDGTVLLLQPVTLKGSGDILGLTFTPPAAGEYRIRIVDVGGNALATGTYTAEP